MLELANARRLFRQIAEEARMGQQAWWEFLLSRRIRSHRGDMGARLHPVGFEQRRGRSRDCHDDVGLTQGGLGCCGSGVQALAAQFGREGLGMSVVE